MKNYFTSVIAIRNFVTVFASLLFFLVTPSLHAQWKHCNGLYGGRITGLFTIGTTLFADSEEGFFKSTDKGETW
ncbi:MAG: hypothetical protein HYZ54_09895, partial [Ignavibacteriae bacterium]|nr:hypothetical protein [Ignavibacteriota bacterium]